MSRSDRRPVVAAATAPALEVRTLRSIDEYAACVRLQRETWGPRYTDCVPASLLKVTTLLGGVCAGALDGDGRLVGFVYGLTGVRDGRLAHWSHMLAVSPSHRDCGVGRRLKEHQRAVVRSQGIESIYWTFDPLVARNAHLNLNRLGAEVTEYVPEMYGSTGSRLHAFGTDRFVVAWPVAARARPEPAVRPCWPGSPVLGAPPQRGPALATLPGTLNGEPVVRVEIPHDVETLPLPEARAWRRSTRRAFASLLAAGYAVSGFYTDERTRSFYVLQARAAAG